MLESTPSLGRQTDPGEILALLGGFGQIYLPEPLYKLEMIVVPSSQWMMRIKGTVYAKCSAEC